MPIKRLRRLFLYLVAIVITLANIAPLIWVFLSGFKTRLEIFTINPPVWIPSHLNFKNFNYILDQRFPNLMNSIVITLASTAGVLLVAVPAAFAEPMAFSAFSAS